MSGRGTDEQTGAFSRRRAGVGDAMNARDEFGRMKIPRNRAEYEALKAEAGLSEAERAALDLWVALERIEDLLTPDETQSLYADLAEMAAMRRRAEVESRNWPMA